MEEVSGHLHTPATLPPEKEQLAPTRQDTWWAPKPKLVLVWVRQSSKIK